MNMERAWIPAGVSPAERRRLFSIWIRTGRIPTHRDDGVELKFNPWHDPRDGRFTSGPGGEAAARDGPSERVGEGGGGAGEGGGVVRSDGVYRPGEPGPTLIPIGAPEPPETRGGNIRAFEDPMTLDELPILRDTPAGALLAPLDGFLNITGPGAEIRTALMRAQADKILADIKALDPNFVYQSFQFPSTEAGQRRLIDDLRFNRAVVMMRVKGDLGPLRVEAVRTMQQIADDAYVDGSARLAASALPVRLHEREALGNFIDQEVRRGLRRRFNAAGVVTSGGAQIAVNRREYLSEGSGFRIPDLRIGDVFFDVSLSEKRMSDSQVRQFFEGRSRPSAVVIVRPRQEGGSYIIRRAK
ncbi:hypothetical protein [Sphingomonas sp. BK069]|uniref:hypothetical protein n=1 Tax=Sphingomonas sp. BK069 TaxID=2586979 RepID=UPI00161A6C6E|nr:hypothetical protein [Sphingomonas sp. BK069]MBB3347631.1 hypothetical protein [Sphingomonas sp. BK069]